MIKFSHKILITITIIFYLLSILPQSAKAQEDLAGKYTVGKVLEITEETKIPVMEQDFFVQQVLVEVKEIEKPVLIKVGSTYEPISADQKLKINDQVIVSWTQVADQETITDFTISPIVVDVFRIPALVWLLGGFGMLVAATAGWRGIFSIMGMFASLGVLVAGVFPQIMAGADPLMASLLGSVVIATITVYLSHGWKQKSHLALLALSFTLVAVTLLSIMAVKTTQLIGLGSEEAAFLKFSDTVNINLKGLFLGGIILGALGVLDDIVISQLSVVHQLKKANKKLAGWDLYFRALEVGKDHIASLVNTLVLAYAGANLPLFLLFYSNPDLPVWLVINNQLIAEEIVRTLVGSMGLVLAVPITTWIAVRWLEINPDEEFGHSH